MRSPTAARVMRVSGAVVGRSVGVGACVCSGAGSSVGMAEGACVTNLTGGRGTAQEEHNPRQRRTTGISFLMPRMLHLLSNAYLTILHEKTGGLLVGRRRAGKRRVDRKLSSSIWIGGRHEKSILIALLLGLFYPPVRGEGSRRRRHGIPMRRLHRPGKARVSGRFRARPLRTLCAGSHTRIPREGVAPWGTHAHDLK